MVLQKGSSSQVDKEYVLSEQMFAGPSSDNGTQENFDQRGLGRFLPVYNT